MRRIFKDNKAEEFFLREGYIIVPFNNACDIDSLKESLLQLNPSDNFKGNQDTLIGKQSFHITFFDSEYDYKKRVYNFVKDVFTPFIHEHIHDFKCVQGNVFLKPPKSGIVFPHQNLTIVDETKYRTFSLWIPLQDTNEENGTLCLIPKTQNDFLKYRNTHVYWPYTDFLASEEGQQYFTSINVKKGELLIIDDRIVHYTPINKTESDRWVLHSLWAPNEAQIQFYNPIDTVVNIYDVSDDFWQYHPVGTLIDQKKADNSIKNNEIILSELEFKEALKKYM